MTGRVVAAILIAGFFAVALLPQSTRAATLNLATVNCEKYESEVLASTVPGLAADPIDTVMWLFGFAIAKSGERAMYGDSLTAFGFALDAECKNNPGSSLLDAVTSVKSKRDNPMDLTRLDCATFETRHTNLRKTDSESANTLMMWLFGYAVGLSGGHLLDADSLGKFDAGLAERCANQPGDSLFDALNAPNPAVPTLKSPTHAKPAHTKRAAPLPALPTPAAPVPAVPTSDAPRPVIPQP
jgi:hypothetical protein